ncbi:MAG TPA: YsnF/AvaK domain-containing protein, partial [Candidatus Caenarcaniphilales bacterium]
TGMAGTTVDPGMTGMMMDPAMTGSRSEALDDDVAVTGSRSEALDDVAYDRNTYSYHNEPALYGMTDTDHRTLRLYEERLIANKRRVKTGEVSIGKRVETEVARASVPVEKERVVIERTTPVDAGTAVPPGEVTFQEGEVARVEIYEETADIHKEAFVREEVNVSKEVDRDTVNAEETLRREELDVDAEGRTVEDRRGGRLPNDRI